MLAVEGSTIWFGDPEYIAENGAFFAEAGRWTPDRQSFWNCILRMAVLGALRGSNEGHAALEEVVSKGVEQLLDLPAYAFDIFAHYIPRTKAMV